MKIIDKNKDYYDYYQNIYRDDTLTFDRRGSYFLSKEGMGESFISLDRWIARSCRRPRKEVIWLLQVGYDNWMIRAYDPIIVNDPIYNEPMSVTDYKVRLEAHWKDYEHCYKFRIGAIDRIKSTYHKPEDIKLEDLINYIRRNDYEAKSFTNWYQPANEEKELPILDGTKIPSVVDAFELYRAFEEYFSHLKDEVVTDNQTDLEKVESHGFDKAYSFRSKK